MTTRLLILVWILLAVALLYFNTGCGIQIFLGKIAEGTLFVMDSNEPRTAGVQNTPPHLGGAGAYRGGVDSVARDSSVRESK